MKYKAIILSVFLVLSITISAQQDSIKQINIELNKDFVGLIQLLHPEFFFSQDEDLLNKNINKNLLEYKYISDYIVPDSIKNDSISQINMEIFLELAEDYYWASLYSYDFEVNDSELFDYYYANIEKFTNPYIFDFWQVWISNPSDLNKAKNELIKMSKTDPEIAKDSKKDEGSFTINFEYDLELKSNHSFYKELVNTPINQLSNEILVGESVVILIPKRKDGGDIVPFEEVKHICENDLRNIKNNEFQKQKNEEIKKLYNISISDDLKKDENPK